MKRAESNKGAGLCLLRQSEQEGGERMPQGTGKTILLITALIWWETMAAPEGNNTQLLPSLHSLLATKKRRRHSQILVTKKEDKRKLLSAGNMLFACNK